jgi:bifunctional non-homologous end joining protein LigD
VWGKVLNVTASIPEWVEPMAATLTQNRFTGPEWVFERKLDGIRLLAFKLGSDVRLLSRNRLTQNAAYGSVANAVLDLPVSELILDGEALGVWGRQAEAGYHVFDVLWLDGRDLTKLPARRAGRA